jgi:hypothetical protein
MKIPWLEKLVGFRARVLLDNNSVVEGVLENVLKTPAIALVLADINRDQCDALVNYGFVVSVTPSGEQETMFTPDITSITDWLRSIAGIQVSVGTTAKVLTGRVLSACDDGPLMVCIGESADSPQPYLNWDNIRMISVDKKAAAQGKAAESKGSPDHGSDDDGAEPTGVTAPLVPAPSDEASAKKELGVGTGAK